MLGFNGMELYFNLLGVLNIWILVVRFFVLFWGNCSWFLYKVNLGNSWVSCSLYGNFKVVVFWSKLFVVGIKLWYCGSCCRVGVCG